MFDAIFRNAAGQEVFRVEDNSLTFLPETRQGALLGALVQFNIAVEDGEAAPEAADTWTQVELHHGYGRDLIQRTEIGDNFAP